MGFISINFDALYYCGDTNNVDEQIRNSEKYTFIEGNLQSFNLLKYIFQTNEITHVIHFAAQSHVQNSFTDSLQYTKDNILGTHNLLEVNRVYNKKLLKFIHVSTDEVYWDIKGKKRSNENYSYNPSSPYSASKASSDHLIKSYVRTFGIKAVISNCCNNYGPGQFPEKLIPTLIFNILNNKPLPIYGKGKNSREWIHVNDHCEALLKIFTKGEIGESYNVGTNNNLTNIILAKKLLGIVKHNNVYVGKNVKIKFVKDRPGHDFRYALESKKIKKFLKWRPKISLQKGLSDTFNWYYNNKKFFNSFSKKKFYKRIGLKK